LHRKWLVKTIPVTYATYTTILRAKEKILLLKINIKKLQVFLKKIRKSCDWVHKSNKLVLPNKITNKKIKNIKYIKLRKKRVIMIEKKTFIK